MLAPRSTGSKRRETMAGLNVVRFQYFFNHWETLANQGGGILNRLKTNRLNYLLLPFFLMGQFAALAGLLRKNEFDYSGLFLHGTILSIFCPEPQVMSCICCLVPLVWSV